MSTPNPNVMARLKRPTIAVAANVNPDSKAKLVRPGLREETVHYPHDGIIKAKALEPGMSVRAYLHDKPCGGVRVVEEVRSINDGAMVRVSFSTPHPTSDYKAAYRFFVEELVGKPVKHVKHVPALVPYEEV